MPVSAASLRRRAARLAVLAVSVSAVATATAVPARADSSAEAGPASRVAAQLVNDDPRASAASGALAALGVDGPEGTEAQLQAVNTELRRLAAVTELFHSAVNAVDIGGAGPGSQVVAERAYTWRNRINALEADIRDAAGAPTASARRQLARAASDRIAAVNQDFGVFVELVAGGYPSADSVSRAAFLRETADGFLTHEESVRIRYFFDAYALYAAKLGWLIVNYRVASGLYSPAQTRTFAESVVSGVARIDELRRTAVPENAVFDARTGLEWSSGRYGVTSNPPKDPQGFVTLRDVTARTNETGWALPTAEQLRGLVSG